MTTPQDILGLAAFLIGATGTVIYISSILRGETRPHIYTHLVWGIVATIAFFTQLKNGGGAGCWAIGITAASCLAQAVLALKYGEKHITQSDKAALVLALAAVLAWVVAGDPLIAVLLGCTVDLVAFYPTFRKSWLRPWTEILASYYIAIFKMFLVIAALDTVSPLTALYPLNSICLNTLFIAACLWRRNNMARA